MAEDVHGQELKIGMRVRVVNRGDGWPTDEIGVVHCETSNYSVGVDFRGTRYGNTQGHNLNGMNRDGTEWKGPGGWFLDGKALEILDGGRIAEPGDYADMVRRVLG